MVVSESCFPEGFDEEYIYKEFLLNILKKVSENLNHEYDKLTKSNIRGILKDFEYIEEGLYSLIDFSLLSFDEDIDRNRGMLFYLFKNYTKNKDERYRWNLIKDTERTLKKIVNSEHIFQRELEPIKKFIEWM